MRDGRHRPGISFSRRKSKASSPATSSRVETAVLKTLNVLALMHPHRRLPGVGGVPTPNGPGSPSRRDGQVFTVEPIDVFTFDANGQNTEHYGVTTRWAR